MIFSSPKAVNVILEEAAQIADRWAKSSSCDMHDRAPCCHVRTGAAIADCIRKFMENTDENNK